MIIGRDVKHYQEVTSTNDVALQLAVQGAEEGTVVTADFQTKGRGRQGRRWFSPRGQGLLVSVILKPNMLLEQSMFITLMSSVAVAGAIEKIITLNAGKKATGEGNRRKKNGSWSTLPKIQIKWPNDIIIDEKKVGGILTETNSEADRIKFAVVGIGLNVNSDIEDLPKGAVSIKEITARQFSITDIQEEVLRHFNGYYNLFKQGHLEQIIEEYRQKLVLLGRQVKAITNGQTIEGQAVDVTTNGALVVRIDTGFLIELRWPEVKIVR